MKLYKQMALILVCALVSTNSYSQVNCNNSNLNTRVTFQDDRIFLEERDVNWGSPKQFYPIGWYSPAGESKTAIEANTNSDGYNESMAAISQYGANTVLYYWSGIFSRYYDGPESWSNATLEHYNDALSNFLDDVHSHNLKAIVDIPTRNEGNHLFLNDYDGIKTIINTHKNHPALLGWYQADEPEGSSSKPSIDYDDLLNRYQAIKTADPCHPVFVVFAKGTFLDLYTNKANGPIYDVLMNDNYVMDSDYFNIPHKNLVEIRTTSGYLETSFYNDYQGSTTSGSTMFVDQGYGTFDIGSDSVCFNNIGCGKMRDPHITETFFDYASSTFRSQKNYGRGTIGGLLYWSHNYANQAIRNSVNEFIEFLSDTEINYAFTQPSTPTISHSVSGHTWPFFSMLREYKDSYYLLLINDQYDSSNYNHSENNLSISISGVENLAHAHQMLPKSMGGDTYYREWLSISQISPGNYKANESGSNPDALDFSPYEVKIFRFTKAIDWAYISNGPFEVSVGEQNSWTAYAEGDNDSQFFYWYKREVGTSTWDYIGSGRTKTYTHNSNVGFDLKVRVKNLGHAQREAIRSISIENSGSGPMFKTQNSNTPEQFNLEQNYPNPFNPTTTINYSIPESSPVRLEVYSLDGRLISTIVNEMKEPGFYSVNFDGSNLSSGLYIYRISTPIFTQTKKFTLLK